MKVSVWDIEPSPESLTAVATLKRLGYRASLRLLPDQRFFAYINDSRNRAQVIASGWTTDYPSASDYIGKLSCAHSASENGTAAGDPGGFCDAAIDRQIERAAAVEATSPAVAARLWARLDRKLTDLAVWVPTVTPTELDLLSSRTSNYQYHPVWGPIVDQLWVR
jgi:peptide/nickel transport system substrate-binding protein